MTDKICFKSTYKIFDHSQRFKLSSQTQPHRQDSKKINSGWISWSYKHMNSDDKLNKWT